MSRSKTIAKFTCAIEQSTPRNSFLVESQPAVLKILHISDSLGALEPRCLFRRSQAWLEMVNLEQEIKARCLKPAFGPMSTIRNKRILTKAIEDEDKTTTETFRV